ncbi:MAG: RNA polymerase sigma-70 factor [Phocaeicola sp.]|uniref:RNA polymerase sigma-70 factor n=1 Tax=Phocaeicola TaxID=909656 RepID=UPI00234E432E|nr:RNA polymerase sigma-70 factor [Phocaeicola oris]MCE2617644.1 RNA polymerase sigma-70 factor [Phocaeicola oris]
MNKLELFNDIYSKYYRRLSKFAWLYVRDNYAAEDIATESMVKLWETMNAEEVENPLALLLVIMKNKSLDYLRGQEVKAKALEAFSTKKQAELNIRISTLEAFSPENIFSDEIRTILSNTLNSMSAQTRRVFMMSRFESKSGKEIAEKLNITVKGVDFHISKALKVLRVALKDYLSVFILLSI